MPDEAFNQIKDTESVKDTWDILKSAYEDCTAMLVSDCMKAFQDTKCQEGGNIQSHSHKLAILCDQLTLLGQTITDRDYLNTLLMFIPCSYKGSISLLNGASFLTKTKITANSFRAFLLDKYERRILMEKEDAKCYILTLPLLFLIPPHPLTHLHTRLLITETALLWSLTSPTSSLLIPLISFPTLPLNPLPSALLCAHSRILLTALLSFALNALTETPQSFGLLLEATSLTPIP
jgi:hypothetical protein